MGVINSIQMGENFGEFIRKKRIENGLILKDFCRKINFDCSEWSKIERGLSSPPQSDLYLKIIAKELNIGESSEEYLHMYQLANSFFKQKMSQSQIEEKVVGALPLFSGPEREVGALKKDLVSLYDFLKKELQ